MKPLLRLMPAILLISACDSADVNEAVDKTRAIAANSWAKTSTYISNKWESGLSLDEALAASEEDTEGKRSIELCELSASGLTDFVGGAATMGAVVPMIAGKSVVVVATSTVGFISIAPAIDPTLTTVATSVAIAYGAMKLYCARDKIMGHQSIQEFVAVVNEYSDQSVEALKSAYAEVLQNEQDSGAG